MLRNRWPLIAALVMMPLIARAELSAGGGPSWNGFMVRFVTKLEPPGVGLLPGAILSDNTGVAHHLINDDAHKRTFGYDLRLEPAPDGNSANLRIEPLHAPQYSVEAGWTLVPLPNYPVIPNVKVGDTVALDLLINPATGQKITDYLTLDRPDRPDPTRARDFSLDDVQLTINTPRISINGQLTSSNQGGISGTVVWIYLQGHGRFIFSLFPDEKFGFQKTGVTNTTALTFRDGADEYRLDCAMPIAPGDGPFNVYIVHEPDWNPYSAKDQIELGAAGKPGSVFAAAFTAVSIKPHPEPVYVSRSDVSGTYATWTATTLRNLITEAWNLKKYQTPEQPSWITSDHFDIAARAGGNAAPSKELLRQMLKTMLAERFHLRVHFETKEIPVYALVPAKSGHKLKAPDMNNRTGYTMAGPEKIEIVASHGTLQSLADQLSNSAGRPVINKTGLDRLYAWKLEFNPATTIESDLPSLPTALQDQLGLRLDPQKAPIEVLVIDSAQKPSAN